MSSIKIVGLRRVRPYVILDELEWVRDEEDVGVAMSHLESLNIFEFIEARRDEDGLVITVEEKQLGSAKVGASTGDNSVSFEASASARSALGHGETFSVSWTERRPAAREVEASVEKKRIRGTRIGARLIAQDSTARFRSKGIKSVLTTPSDVICFEFAKRDCSHKLSGKFSTKVDARDSRAAPTQGYSGECSVEAAGFFDAQFAKFQTAFQKHFQLAFGIASISARAGALRGGRHFGPDRFYLSDYHVRGFASSSSPSPTEPSGSTFCSVLAMISFPLYQLLRGHFFLTAANVGGDDLFSSFFLAPTSSSSLGNTKTTTRLIAGCGLSIAPSRTQGLLRLEINYAAIIRNAQPFDIINRFHFNLNADFS